MAAGFSYVLKDNFLIPGYLCNLFANSEVFVRKSKMDCTYFVAFCRKRKAQGYPIVAVWLAVLSTTTVQAQVFTTDLEHFWTTRDSVLATRDTTRQIELINRLYIGKASPGLAAFMRNKEDLPRKWRAFITQNAESWLALKKKMPVVEAAAAEVKSQIRRFRTLYPDLRPAETYFLIGLGMQGGTVRGNLSLLCVEVILRDAAAPKDQLVFLAVHEYVHTQQKRPDFQKINVLTSCIREGACDFVASLVTGRPVTAGYSTYGLRHEKEVWEAFQKDMYTGNNDNWVSTGPNPALPAPDLGYFVGHQVCEAYYRKSADKAAALKTIIELDYADPEAVSRFWQESGYKGGRR